MALSLLLLRISFILAIAIAIAIVIPPSPAAAQNDTVTVPRSPSNASLGSYLPSPASPFTKVLESPSLIFSLTVKSWRDSPSDFCMAAVSNEKIDSGSMAWSASLSPIPATNCSLYLTPQGELQLLRDEGDVVWSTNTAGMGVSSLALLDSGNLVLTDARGSIVWQSFAQTPFFQLYGAMNLTSTMTLCSSSPVSDSNTDFSIPGSFGLRFDAVNSRLLLFARRSGFVYWSYTFDVSDAAGGSSAYNSSSAAAARRYVRLEAGGFALYNDDDSGSTAAGTLPADMAAPDGSLTVALVDPITADLLAFYWATHNWILTYNSSMHPCQSPQTCGDYGLCSSSSSSSSSMSQSVNCSCPPGFLPKVVGKGCVLPESMNASGACNSSSSHGESAKYEYVSVNVSFEPQLLLVEQSAAAPISAEKCAAMCSANCSCAAVLYDPASASCSLLPSVPTMLTRASSSQLMLLKVVASGGHSGLSSKMVGILVACISTLLGITAIGAACLWWWCWRRRRRKGSKRESDDEMFLQAIPRLPPRYTYKELEVATKGFSSKLGAGGFGSVYDGTDSSGARIAVKKLEMVTGQSSAQVRAEVATIGSISHMNLVTLKGFCIEGELRLLVYEYMPNGSLDRWLFDKGTRPEGRKMIGDGHGQRLSWERRWTIAIDTARGLAYLHHELAERIVHCDVKPENILLDEGFHAKVADFGLAKLLPGGTDPKQSFAITTLKGTRGYIAPEWIQDATITAKSDVYSYGVVLLELVSGRRSMDSDYGYLPTMAFELAANASSLVKDVAMSESAAKFDDDGGGGDDGTTMNHQRAIGESLTMNHQRAIDVGALCEDLLDRSLGASGDSENSGIWKEQVERMVATAMWCVQPQAARRPTMASVMQMLEGVLPIAPIPLLSSTSTSAPFFFDGSEPHIATSKASSLSSSTVLTIACTSTTAATTTPTASDPPSPFLSDAKS